MILCPSPLPPVVAYSEADAGRTIWYYQPLREKKALWTTPYVNDNNGVRMISYVMPVFVQGQFVAVVGVDIDFNMLCDLVGNMKVYDSGYGFLFKDWQTFYFHPDGREVAYEFKPRFDIVSHGELLEQSATDTHLIHYYYQGIPMAMGFATLKNGMKLGVTAPEREIYAGRQLMTFLVLAIIVLVGLLSTLLAIRAANRIVRPLHDISEAAGQAAFAVVMVDLNQLKDVNDRFGHEKGNIALQRLCQAVCRIYKHSPVYRIGGDEFVVILEGEDYAHRDALFEKVRAFEHIRDLSAAQPWTQLAASVGMAVYDKTRDTAYRAVFNRADTKMYEQKQHLAPRA